MNAERSAREQNVSDSKRRAAAFVMPVGLWTAMRWYQGRCFLTDAQARGAFLLAQHQGQDGMGRSTPEWMGLNDEDYDNWMRNSTLPPLKRR